LWFVSITFFIASAINAQEYTLEAVINLAKTQSIAKLSAETQLENRYWNYQSILANYKPRLYLSGNLPNFNRYNSAVTQPDGTIAFRRVSQNFTELNLYAEQRIAQWGTRIYLNSNLERFDNFEPENRNTSYNGNPAVIGIEQPFFQFNALAWDKKIEPLRYKQAQIAYSESVSKIELQTSRLFFEALLGQIALSLANRNLNNADTTYQISKERYLLGGISENELLRLELVRLEAQQTIDRLEGENLVRKLALERYIGEQLPDNYTLAPPEFLPVAEIEPQQALQFANQLSPQQLNNQIKLLEAERELDLARKQNRFQVNLSASYGLTQNANEFRGIFEDPQDRQRVRLGFDVPILDWGRSKASINSALANQKLAQYEIQQAQENFQQNLINMAVTFNTLPDRVSTSRRAMEISRRSFEVTQAQYLSGQVDLNQLLTAYQLQDTNRKSYIEALRSYWTTLFELQTLTLYDFRKQEPLPPAEQP
jgi:outer membrane protein TolC